VRIAAVFVLAAPLVWAADTPETLVSAGEAEPIHSAIIRKEAWTLDPVRRLRAEAENCLKEGPWTVTSDRPKGIDLDAHEYYSESPYWWPNPANPAGPFVRRAGQPNPARFTANHAALNAMSEAVFTLGAAAFFLDDPRYAQRAARDIQAWFIAPRTRMNPAMQHAQAIPGSVTAGGFSDGRALVRVIQGMEFLAQSANWDARDHAAVRKWFEEYLHWLMQSGQDAGASRSPADRNAWWAAEVAAGATFAEDSTASGAAFDYFRNRILPRQARANPVRDPAAPPPPPPAAGLEGMATLCRIAQVRGVELWNTRTRGVVAVAGLIDRSAPNVSDPKKWNRDQLASFQGDGVYFLAFAGMGLSRPDYIALYRKLERPDSGWLAVVDLLVSRWEAAGHQTRH
jgi:Alginate lyase